MAALTNSDCEPPLHLYRRDGLPFADALRGMGVEVAPSQANFLFFRTPGKASDLAEALAGADVFIGVSAGLIPEELIASMNDDSIVFALSNPDPEIHPEAAAKYAAIVATGRSDFPNQINNVLAFPGVFKGALDAGARRISEGMKIAAAEAIFSVVADDLRADRIVPSPLDDRVAPAVAAAVADVARFDGRTEIHDPQKQHQQGLLGQGERGRDGVVSACLIHVEMNQEAVAQLRPVASVGVGDLPVEDDVGVPGRRPVDSQGDGVEELIDRHGTHDVGGRGRGRSPDRPVAQLVCAHEIEVAPGAVLGAVAELLERVRLETPRLLVRRIGEDDVVQDLGDPAEVARLEGSAGLPYHLVRAAHELDMPFRRFHRRMLPQVRRIPVEPSHVTLVDGLHVVAHRAVVAVRVPGVRERGW